MPMLSVRHLTKSFGTQRILHDISLEVSGGQIVALLGASGSGKSTLMRCIAGLEPLDAGEILWQDAPLQNIPSHERGFGLVFQDFALFPHMTVAENIAFGLRMAGKSATEQRDTVATLLKLIGLEGYGDRHVDTLSGGQKQRVALARSLAPRPRLLMLDEPLGSLDAVLREQLAIDIRAILKETHTTALYVTHDLREAFASADAVAVMQDGIIDQIGTPQELFSRPRSAYTARLLGLTNVLPASLFGDATQTGEVLLHAAHLRLAADADNRPLAQAVVARVTYEGWRHRIDARLPSGHEVTLYEDGSKPAPQPGEAITLHTGPDAIIPLAPAPAGRITR